MFRAVLLGNSVLNVDINDLKRLQLVDVCKAFDVDMPKPVIKALYVQALMEDIPVQELQGKHLEFMEMQRDSPAEQERKFYDQPMQQEMKDNGLKEIVKCNMLAEMKKAHRQAARELKREHLVQSQASSESHNDLFLEG